MVETIREKQLHTRTVERIGALLLTPQVR